MKSIYSYIFVLTAVLFVVANVSYAQSNQWVRASGSIPAGAVSGGHEDNKRETFICRVSYQGSFIGGKALDDRCYYNPGNGEVSVSRFDVLVGAGYSWKRSGSTSKAVVVGGSAEENSYVCRVLDNGGLYPGRTENGRCYYTRNNRGYSNGRYETLQSARSRTGLLDAASRGDYRAVRNALSEGWAIDERDSSGRTPLMLAAKGGHENAVQELLYGRPQVNARDKEGNTALILAAANGNSDVVEQLFRAGADPGMRNEDGENAFVAAAEKGSERVMRLFLEDRRYGGVDSRDMEEALDRSAYSGQTSIVKMLVGNGVDPDTRGRNGMTPLMRAAAGGRADTVSYLLGKSVTVFARDDLGYTPVVHAVLADSVKVLKVFAERSLVRSGDETTKEGLLIAAREDKRDALEYFLELGVDINTKDELNGNNALIYTASEGHGKATEMLLKFGVPLDEQNFNGRTALMEAAGNSKKNTLKLLIKAGAQLNMRDNSGLTALGLAIRNGHSDTRKELQKAKAAQ